MVQSVDGKTLAAMLVHASASLNAEKQKINELNVFPVPDGDTGTNMGLTLGTAAAELRQKAPTTAAQASALCASAMLRGARGNSGVILSLIFRGFSRAMKDKDTMDGIDLADALNAGVVAAYKAVMKPAEGTVLTVSRLAGDRAGRAAEENTAFEYVLGSALERAREALADTVNQNPVLKKAGVVDAGGMGFVVILQGMLDELHGIPAPADDQEPSPVPQREKADFGGFETGEIQFGYCTEFICSRDTQKDPEALRAFLNGLGDSLVLVDDDEIIKVHVHTNHPGKVLEEALTYGGLLTVKVENMRQQHTELLQQEGETAPRQSLPPEKKYGFVAVAAGEGLAKVFFDLGVDGVIQGGQPLHGGYFEGDSKNAGGDCLCAAQQQEYHSGGPAVCGPGGGQEGGCPPGQNRSPGDFRHDCHEPRRGRGGEHRRHGGGHGAGHHHGDYVRGPGLLL